MFVPDSPITKEEFLRFTSVDFTTTIDKDDTDRDTDHEDDEFKFGLMDSEHTGKVSWCQFINYTSIQILSRRTKVYVYGRRFCL